MLKDWFKARNIWGAAIQTLSDAEAGRLMKAIWDYTMTGNQQNLSGAEKGIFALVLMTLSLDEETERDISAKRSIAGSMGGKQKQANATFATDEQANVANATNKSKSKSKNKEEDIKDISLTGDKEKPLSRFTPPTVDEVAAYCQERGNNIDPQKFVDYYQSQKWKKSNGQPLTDWKAGVRTWEGREKERPTGNVRPMNPAQNYSQRDYSEKPETLEDLMRKAGAL